MRDVKKVLEMRSQNYSQRQISVSLKISRNTIRKIFNVADDKKVCWSSVKDLSESDVQNLLFEQETKINLSIKQPDFDYIHKELLVQFSDFLCFVLRSCYGKNMLMIVGQSRVLFTSIATFANDIVITLKSIILRCISIINRVIK